MLPNGVLMVEIGQISFLPSAVEVTPAVDNMLQQAARERIVPVEHRAEPRYPYSKLICLLPTNRSSLAQIDDPIWVVSKGFSRDGLGFFHQQPIPYRDLLMQVEPAAEELWLLLRIRWCRFLRLGWYESGGQFVKTVAPDPHRGESFVAGL